MQAIDKLFQAPLEESELAALREAVTEGGNAELAAEVVRLLQQYAVILEVTRTVASELSLDVLLPSVIDIVTRAVGADRGTLFLHDPDSGELYSRVSRGGQIEEIRIPADAGIAGSVFASGEVLKIPDAYADSRFNAEVDRRTGYRTRNILCAPLRNRAGAVIGVTQVLNKGEGAFGPADAGLLSSITAQAAAALEHAQLFERIDKARSEETRMMELISAIASDLNLESLLAKIIEGATSLLEADRGTLFVYDEATDELWSRVAEGEATKEIRIRSDAGVAGWVFTNRKALNIPDAYADPRFNREVDKATGYRTRTILCAPIVNRFGDIVGVSQILNKRAGPFGADDERRLRAFSAQVVTALENAQLFDEVLRLKNYNEGILKSLTNGVVTFDSTGVITKANEAAGRILATDQEALFGRTAQAVFGNTNPWIVKSLAYVTQTGNEDFHPDMDLLRADGDDVSVNLTAVPLHSIEDEPVGSMLVLEDITREKRVRTTMARYLAKEVVDKLLESGEDVLAGTTQEATVLFSDIRRFTTIAEKLGTQDTVAMLNEYFTAMVEVIFRNGGLLDKYIGDAIMAVFGAPVTDPYDADNAVRVANEMMLELRSFNERRAKAGHEPIAIGVGVSTGEVLAGSIGSEKRMEYTVIGNTVNLAARLESATKHYGTSLLLGEHTVERLSAPRDLREIDLIRAKGLAQPIAIYESTAHYPDDVRDRLSRLATVYGEGVAAYRSRQWNDAIGCFEEALKRRPDDGPSQVYRDRCRYFRDTPPGEDWDGVWTMTEK